MNLGDLRMNERKQKIRKSSTRQQVQQRLSKLQEEEPFELKSHLDSLNDGVIAIIITIMVLEVPLPSQSHVSYGDLLETIFIFLVSFFVVANFWYGLNRILLMLRRASKRLMIYDFCFLAALSLVPILTKWMMIQPSRLAVINYGIVYFIVNLMKTCISAAAWKQLFEEIDGTPKMFSVRMGKRLLLILVSNAILIGLAWYIPRWVLFFYLLISIIDFFFPERTAVDEQVKN